MSTINSTELISVIIPMYNAQNTIYAALDSITRQTEGNFEIIIVNDGSTDNSLGEVYAFKKRHPHLNIIIIDKAHEGVSMTRNTGLRIATGNYIAFLDADDEWYPEKTIKQLNILNQTPDIAVVGCLHKPGRSGIERISRPIQVKAKDMLFKNFSQTSTILMKIKVFDAIGYFEKSISYGEERRYFLHASKVFSCVLINENLINYGNGKRGFGQTGLSGDLMQMEIGELRNLLYAYKVLNMPLFSCCNAIIFSLMKFARRLCIVYITDRFKP